MNRKWNANLSAVLCLFFLIITNLTGRLLGWIQCVEKHCFIQLGIPSAILFTDGAAYKVRSNAYLKFFEVCATNRSRETQTWSRVKHKRLGYRLSRPLSSFPPSFLFCLKPADFFFNAGFMLGSPPPKKNAQNYSSVAPITFTTHKKTHLIKMVLFLSVVFL